MGYQNWQTPPAFIQWCERRVLPHYGFDEFGLDACAEPHNAKASRFLAPESHDLGLTHGCVGIDGLSASWGDYGAVWCNPGFSECGKWLDKAAAESRAGVTSLVLTHLTCTAQWFHRAKSFAPDRWYPGQRIQFLPPEGVTPSSNPKDSLLWVFGPLATGQIFEPGDWRAAK